ncbi:MAG: L-threonylcarbamoyladenylate synthase [Bauldia sp.]
MTSAAAAREGGLAAGYLAAVRALAEGRLVAMPTETVYGLAADATNAHAVAGIFEAKGRPAFNPLIIHCASVEEARAHGVFDPVAEQLAEAFWPGPMTLVLERQASSPVADLATAGLGTIALRVPAHPVANELISTFGRPLAAPSANRSGRLSATAAAHVIADLGDAVAVVLDAGPSPVGVESTIVSTAGGKVTVLRPGAIPRAAIKSVARAPLASAGPGSAIAAPGMLALHYAPEAHLRLNATVVLPGEALLTFGGGRPPGWEKAAGMRDLSPAGSLREAAANLFSALRMLDERADVIAVTPIPGTGLGEAINDRLARASAPRLGEDMADLDQVVEAEEGA